MSAIDDYLRRLEHELKHRGLDDARIIDEAREHLVDAVDDAQRRGLSLDEAVSEAFERFGAPEIIAAQALVGRSRVMNRFATAPGLMWQRKWWILAPTIATAVVTSVLTHYALPTRYRSESTIRIISARVPTEYVRPAVTQPAAARFQLISQMILSRTRLERTINEFGLYEAERESVPLGDVVQQMRNDITINFLPSDPGQENDVGGLHVSFVSSDPRMAMKITDRLTAMIVQENLRDREVQFDSTSQFIDSQIEDVRFRIGGLEGKRSELRAQSTQRALSQTDLVAYEVLQERYKKLLMMREEARAAANLERRQISEQFRLIEAARLPERPIGPSRLGVNIGGTLAGLALGLVIVGVRGRSNAQTGTA